MYTTVILFLGTTEKNKESPNSDPGGQTIYHGSVKITGD